MSPCVRIVSTFLLIIEKRWLVIKLIKLARLARYCSSRRMKQFRKSNGNAQDPQSDFRDDKQKTRPECKDI